MEMALGIPVIFSFPAAVVPGAGVNVPMPAGREKCGCVIQDMFVPATMKLPPATVIRQYAIPASIASVLTGKNTL